MRRAQRTISHPAELAGIGLFTGENVRMRLLPAEPDSGVVFRRVDLEGSPEIAALADNLTKPRRRTILKRGDVEVNTVEHLLAACCGLRVDNLMVELEGSEVPSVDGSSLPIATALAGAGVVDQDAPRKEYAVSEPLVIEEGDATLVVLPATEGFSIQYLAELPGNGGGSESMMARWSLDPARFTEDIAGARTWCLADEVEDLKKMGIGQGLAREHTLVVDDPGDVSDLRFPGEPATHKILDVMGDLFLLGADLRARVIATRSGHAANARMVRLLTERMRAEEAREEVRDTGLDVRKIMKLLPHRYPFLLLDRVVEIEGFQRAVAVKNVSINEPFFQGHWPEAPIMPGVLQLEAMAQLAGVLLLRKLENTDKRAVLWAIDKVRFKGRVVPGDQLVLEVETQRMRSSMGQVSGRGRVGDKVVCEALLTFTMVDG